MYGRDYFSLGIGDKQVIDNIDCSANDSGELTGFNAQFPADHSQSLRNHPLPADGPRLLHG
jgi:hypothetical protein